MTLKERQDIIPRDHAMAIAGARTAADQYAARVDAVLAQRTRLRGPQPPGDLFAGLPADHPLMKADPRRPLDPNPEFIASYIAPDDVIIDVGGGTGRVSLPLALRSREVINVDPSVAMGAGFTANAALAGISNARVITGDWLTVDPPVGTVALVNNVTYLTREIVPFVEKLERAGKRRVVITVNSPPPPSWNRVLYQLVHGETEEVVPGHVELISVLWELGILPDIRVLPLAGAAFTPATTREAAIAGAVGRFAGDQWSLWPMGADLEQRLRGILDERFDELFAAGSDGYIPRWITPGRTVLITWQPQI
jgi:SAM-dependent methyltransferase